MSIVDINGEDSWLKEYEYAGILLSDIKQATVRRRQFQLGNREHAKISSELRKLIPQAELQLATLLNALDDPSSTQCTNIVPGERERRQRLCENLQSALKKASTEFHRGLPREGPFTKVADLGTVNWREDENDQTKNYTIAELRHNQQSMLNDQDEILDNLADCVKSQRQIAKAIQSEVEDQDDLLIDIKDRTGEAQNTLEQQTANIAIATRQTCTWGYWLVILGLLIAIVIVATW